ncbi:phage nozzle protein [Xanthobacter wiegelii]|uniref:phage nozzle protein n=1 Tax=Xanthobacter wiegelii TaxID=3119913 RepID=UPI00372CBDA6
MGKLIEQAIPTMFSGVSRQPDPVRFTGQVEDAENVSFSVETGGFSPRMPLRLIKKLSGMAPGVDRKIHVINRDVDEKYIIVLSNGSLRVFDRNGVEKTVNIASGGTAWLSEAPDKFSILTAVDYTFIAKRTVTVQMDTASLAPAAPSDAVVYVAQNFTSQTDVFSVTINSTTTASVNASTYGSNWNAVASGTIANLLATSLTSSLGSGWTVNRTGSYIFIRKNDGANFLIEQQSGNGDKGIELFQSSASNVADAPEKARHGMMLNIKGVTGEGFWIKFEANNTTLGYGDGVWRETMEPGKPYKFLQSTMPWGLVRETDGSFTLKTLTWNDKTAGGEKEVPAPDFVNDRISDLVFTRNRLGIVSGETCYFSAAGDYFNFWPETSTELVDSDPFGMTNTTNSISKFYYAVPFRRSIFVMADNAQFEIGGDMLSPASAVIDLATAYSASTSCRPVAVGDELYFPADSEGETSILSYVYNDRTVSETANDVTKHCRGFVPRPVIEMVGDPIGGQVLVLSAGARSDLYSHRFFYQGNERVQSAWSRFRFPGLVIRSMARLNNRAMILAEFRGSVWLAELLLNDERFDNYDWVPRLDYHQFLTGSYNAGTNKTTWDLGFAPENPIAITSNLFPSTHRMLSIPLTISGTVVSADGDWSMVPMMIGEEFTSFTTLSKQFLRDDKGTAIVNGRLQLRVMTLRFTDSGFFNITITPYGRDPKTWTYTGRQLGDVSNTIQSFPITSGRYRFWINSNSESTSIKIWSSTFLPYTITSAAWIGFFNEVSRQG